MNRKRMKLVCSIWRGPVTIRVKVFVFGSEWKMLAPLSRPSFSPIIHHTAPEFSNWKRKCQRRWKNTTNRLTPTHNLQDSCSHGTSKDHAAAEPCHRVDAPERAERLP